LHPDPGDVFADLGCGKGPAVIVAARLPFQRVIGVELAPDLSEIARENVERARNHLRSPAVTIVTADMLDWPIPDDLSVVYLYCPVVGDTFSRLAERLIASYDASPRRLRIVYNYPWEHNRLLGTGRVRVTDVSPARWPARPRWWEGSQAIVTYELVPEGALRQPVAPSGRRRDAALERWSGPNDTTFRLHREGRPTVVSR
ncbi:MAG: trans-aconitate 2-methyltransferase, partial [Gaiellaceae bacterium]